MGGGGNDLYIQLDLNQLTDQCGLPPFGVKLEKEDITGIYGVTELN